MVRHFGVNKSITPFYIFAFHGKTRMDYLEVYELNRDLFVCMALDV